MFIHRLRTHLSRAWVQASLVGTLTFAVYVRTLAPTVMWYDMGEFATASYILGVAHNTGYPLYLLLGKLFTFLPFGDVAYRVNLMSAVFASLTVIVVYFLVFLLTHSRSSALIASLTIGFSSTLWSNATWAVSYDLNAFLTVLILLFLLIWQDRGKKKWIYSAVWLFGLSFGNHRLILVLAAPILVLLWRNQRAVNQRLEKRDFIRLGLLFLLGFSVNLYLPLRAMQDPPVNWGDPSNLKNFLTMITTGYGRSFINPFENVPSFLYRLRLFSVFPVYEITLFGLLLAALGGLSLWRRDRPTLALAALIAAFTALMISVYGIHNIFNYFQPIYLMLAILLGCGVQSVLEFLQGDALTRVVRLVFLTPPRRTALAALLLLGIPLYLFGRNFQNVNRSYHRDAADYSAFLFSTLEDGAVVLSDFWSWTPVLYANVVEKVQSKISVSSALSVPGLDQEAEIDRLLEAGASVYLAAASEDSPHLQMGEHRLQLIAPNVIHFYPTHLVPLPEYKDLLVPKGGVYKVLSEDPAPMVEEVPESARMSGNFGGLLALQGSSITPGAIEVGEPFELEYYWTALQPLEKDYWVDILFTDRNGNLVTRAGIPIWLGSHWIGGGAYPTSAWEPDQIYRESYFGLVPRSVSPGVYFIRAFLYEDALRQTPVLAHEGAAPDGSILLGAMEVRAK